MNPSLSPQPSSVLFDDFLSPALKAKELANQIGWVMTHKKREYALHLVELQHHKSIDVRRRSVKALAQVGNSEMIESLRAWQVKESDRETYLALESLIDKLQRGVLDDEQEAEQKVLSVSEAVGLVKNLVGSNTYTIEGELTEIRPIRQMYYFGMKDAQDTRLNCWMFAGIAARLGFPLNEGLQVKVTGQFKFTKDSRLYFNVQTIKLTGEGELLRNLKLLEEKLTKEGLFDPERKRRVSIAPKNVLLLASPNSAALTDFTKVLGARRNNITIFWLPIKTQGIGAEYELGRVLEYANTIVYEKQIDTIVITRGGGSNDDLAVFNSEKIVRAVHALQRPVIAAIGHERDVTLAELAADLRASTPSNAAELVSLSEQELTYKIDVQWRTMYQIFQERKHEYRRVAQLLVQKSALGIQQQVADGLWQLQRSEKAIQSLLYNVRLGANSSYRTIHTLVRQLISDSKYSIQRIDSFQLQMKSNLNQIRSDTRYSWKVLVSQYTHRISSNQEKLRIQTLQLQSLDPQKILEKGYAIVSQNGKIVSKVQEIDVHQELELIMHDGKAKFGIQNGNAD